MGIDSRRTACSCRFGAQHPHRTAGQGIRYRAAGRVQHHLEGGSAFQNSVYRARGQGSIPQGAGA